MTKFDCALKFSSHARPIREILSGGRWPYGGLTSGPCERVAHLYPLLSRGRREKLSGSHLVGSCARHNFCHWQAHEFTFSFSCSLVVPEAAAHLARNSCQLPAATGDWR